MVQICMGSSLICLHLRLGLFLEKYSTPPLHLYVPVDAHKIVELKSSVFEKWGIN
jgi:hypothetical protein